MSLHFGREPMFPALQSVPSYAAYGGRMSRRGRLAALALLLICCWFPLSVNGDVIYQFSIDTSGLEGLQSLNPDPNTGLPELFSLDIQLNTTGSPDVHSATFSNFNFGGGSAGTELPPIGGGVGAGDMSSSFTISDQSSSANDFTQQFIAGDTLSFDVSLTNASTLGLDALVIRILDQEFNNLSTSDPGSVVFGGDSFLTLNLQSLPLQAEEYMASGAMDVYGQPVTITAPTFTPMDQGAVPEPATFVLLAIGLVGLIGSRWRWKRVAA